MLSKRENALLALKGEVPEYVPCFYDACQIIPAATSLETPAMGASGYDGYGVHQTPTESAGGMFTPTPTVKPVLKDITQWKSVVQFPDYSQIPFELIVAKERELLHLNPELFVQDLFCPNGIFERLHFLMGFEDAMCAIYDEPEAVYDLVGAIADKKIEYLKLAQVYYKPDYFTLLDDYSHLTGLFISPDIFRKFFKPHLARIVAACKQTGMVYKQHCCGKLQDLFDDFLDIGITAFDPVQPVNDIVKLKEKAKGKAGIMGGLDVQNVVDRVDAMEQEIEAEVKRCITTYGPGGGYMIYGASVNMFNPAQYAPGGRIFAVSRACEKYGRIY
ncbi:MAG TPA: hypothetical protein GXX75_24810 [Clostridiales bacterium]|nr:hypothetical protein [Clostridiales bacterium]